MASDLARGDEKAHGQQIDFVKSPNGLLEFHGFRKLGILR
jgi:hypothetical protein